jgi:hypothetical protein
VGAGRTELVVELELAARRMKEPPEVDVVGAGLERAPHHLEVEAVVDAVDDDVRSREAGPE